jgi:NADP-dependent 3-hydroxy acid dehydrogenase YdfG
MDSEFTIYPRLKGKLVLITGASAGIGKSTAFHFAACGANLILAARRLDRLEEMKAALEKQYGVQVTVAQLDLMDVKACEQFYENLPVELRENVDILVNNAGLAKAPSLTYQINWDHMNEMIDTNVKGVVKMLNMFVPGMVKNKSGHIITVGSIAGKDAYPNGAIYCGTKHMIEAINTSLRHELMATPIRVSLISPGMVETEFSIVRFGDKEKADNVYKGLKPLNGDDIADNIVYVASRPPHVQVVDMIIFPTNQAAVTTVHREPVNEQPK